MQKVLTQTLQLTMTKNKPGMTSDKPAIVLVTAKPTDFEALVALRIAAMRESLERVGRFDAVRAKERFRSGFAADRTRHIEFEGQRVGFVVTKPQVDYLLLDHLYIHPDQQCRGIGTETISFVIREAQALALPIRLGALRESDANRFYLRHGFVLAEQGEFDNFYVRSPVSIEPASRSPVLNSGL